MKLRKSKKLILLHLAFCFLFCLIIVKAQNKADSKRLDGTKWKGATSFILPTGLQSETDYEYDFKEDNKVKVSFLTQVSGWSWVNEYNVSTARYENVYKFSIQSTNSGNESGTYKKNGDLIQLVFPNSHQIDAQIKGNQMIGKLTTRTGEKIIWSAVISENKSVISKVESNSSEGAALADDLSKIDLSDPKLYRRTLEAQASGIYKINMFSNEQKGLLRIEFLDIRKVDNLSANFSFHSLSGQLSGEIIENKLLKLNGLATLKGSSSETKYQCTITALIKDGTLTEGKYYCESGSDFIKGTFETAIVKTN